MNGYMSYQEHLILNAPMYNMMPRVSIKQHSIMPKSVEQIIVIEFSQWRGKTRPFMSRFGKKE